MPNHLIHETSPYLLQHVNNPVDWYPWNQAALEKAKKEDKPILLSIGYSACHWCHVMAHESFEDEATAQLMNELFINIKADREERPDLDKIYQTSFQLLTQHPGGWPLTVFLTPDTHMPFFVGTYFPRETTQQMPAFKDVLRFVADVYRNRKDDIQAQNTSLLAALNNTLPKTAAESVSLNAIPLTAVIAQLSQEFDAAHGGFGDAPKFPHPIYLQLLLHQSALPMLEKTLTQMALGGIYDQLGGGFFRYSVDAEWQIPHFEKMLYDNAQLLILYAEAYAVTRNPLFAKIAEETGEWVIREMQSPEGSYYSTLDADSEGQEGKFYIWDVKQIENLLTPDEYKIIRSYYGLDQPANFEHAWHLHIPKNSARNEEKNIQIARQKLLIAREKRIHPGRDEKVLTSWNALMIKAMATAGRYLQNPKFVDSAERALKFIYQKMWDKGRLLATYKNNRARLSAYLDDYAFLIDAILTLIQVHWNSEYMNFAHELADVMLKNYQDNQQGGFYFTADDHESLIYKPKNFFDEAIPAGNGIAALVLLRMGYITGDQRYIQAAEKTLKLIWPSLQQHPQAYGSSLLALEEFLQPPEIIVMRGDEKELQQLQDSYFPVYKPHRLIFAINSQIKNLPSYFVEKQPLDRAVAYVCQGYHCLPPSENISVILSENNERRI